MKLRNGKTVGSSDSKREVESSISEENMKENKSISLKISDEPQSTQSKSKQSKDLISKEVRKENSLSRTSAQDNRIVAMAALDPNDKQYADTLDMSNIRSTGGHPRTGIAWLDAHLQGLDTWQIEEVLAISQLKPGLCVAGAGALTPSKLREKNINLVINVTKEIEAFSGPEVENGNISVAKVPVYDIPSTNLAKFMKPIARLVYANKLAGGNCVIHCVLGVSRSVTLCAAYLIFYYDFSVARALTFIQAQRPIINPNGGFKGQLKSLEEYCKKYGRDIILSD